MVNLAMIGAGGYAYELIKRIWEIPDQIKLVAVSSSPLRKSAGREACLTKNIPVYDDIDSLIENVKGKAEVIFVPSPIHTHFTITKKCVDAGFDVFLEKPPVAAIQELDELIRHTANLGKIVPVAFQYLHSDILQELKKRIVQNRYGRVKRLCAMAGWPRFDTYYTRSQWAGKLHIGSHFVLDGTINNPLAHMLADELYLASSVPGQMIHPITVQAELYHGHDIESEDTSSLRIISDTGIEILFNASLCSETRMDPSVIIECEKARIEYVGFSKAVIMPENGEIEVIEDGSEKRIHMLRKLAQCYENGEPYPVTLQTCRPFTLAVNGAFDSCGLPHSIPSQYLTNIEQGEPNADSIKTVINNIDATLKKAHEKSKLFSEIDVVWAKKSKIFDLKNYKAFPTNTNIANLLSLPIPLREIHRYGVKTDNRQPSKL